MGASSHLYAGLNLLFPLLTTIQALPEDGPRLGNARQRALGLKEKPWTVTGGGLLSWAAESRG